MINPVPKPACRKRISNPLKPARLIDPAAVEAARKPYSEFSGFPTYGAAVHHVISVGAGGPDHRFNLIQLTAEEHVMAHKGLIKREQLFAIIAEREGVSAEFVRAEIRIMRRRR